MHEHDLGRWQHDHAFLTGREHLSERATRRVVAITAFAMVAEVVGGAWFNSMALLADGWHMATHVGALGIAAFAYSYARRHINDPRFTFGTGKVGALAGFTSAVVLAAIAAFVAWESLLRLSHPLPIQFDEALVIAWLGLVVNLASAWMLRFRHDEHHPVAAAHGSGHAHDRHHHGHDHNLRAAYLHVLADAMTSVLAIIALALGKLFGLVWVDPAMGIVGSLVIVSWSVSLLRQTGSVLLDESVDEALAGAVRDALAREPDTDVTDLHLWRIAPGHCAGIVSILTHEPRAPSHYKALLGHIRGLAHVTVEVNRCDEP